MHGDHAGGIAELQRLSGAIVVASPASVQALRQGMAGEDDPQFKNLSPFPQIGAAQAVADGEAVRVGPLAVTAVYTPGYTISGVSWTWTACQQGRCASMVFADSLNPLASEGYRFSAHSSIVQNYGASYTALSRLPCDVMVASHPDAAALREQAARGTLISDGGACKRYVAASRDGLKARLNQRTQRGAVSPR